MLKSRLHLYLRSATNRTVSQAISLKCCICGPKEFHRFSPHTEKKKEKKTYQCLDLRSRWGGQSCFFSAAKMYPVCVSLMWRTNTERRRANGHTRRRRRHSFSFQLFKEGRTLWFFLLFFIAKAATGTTMHFQFNLFVWMEREGTNVTRVLFFGLNKRKEVRAEPQLRDNNQGFSSSVCFIRLWASWWRVCFCSGHKWRRRCVCVCVFGTGSERLFFFGKYLLSQN